MSLASGIIKALPGLISDPSSIPSLLAQNLPQASTFFLTYILLQGLTGTAGGFLQAVTLLLHYIKLKLLGSTPRSIYDLKYGARSVAWGTLFPSTTLIIVIGLGYSIIAPVINGLVCVCMLLFYVLYKYLFLWVLEQPASSDTGGLFFPKAINHIFVGLYVQQVLLAALFFLAAKGTPTPIPEGALMIVLILVTAIFQMMINNSYGPLLHSLPLSLVDRIEAAPLEVQPAQQPSGSVNPDAMETKMAAEKAHYAASSPTSPDGNQDMTPAEHDYGFAHPAASRPQRTIWLARDALGLGAEEEKANREKGIDVSTRDAQMDIKGNVEIEGPPPGEEE